MNIQHKAQPINMATLRWTFIGSAVLCYAYAAYVILCAIALNVYWIHVNIFYKRDCIIPTIVYHTCVV